MVVEVDSSGRAEATLAVLKPDAVAAGKASEMELAIEAAGFTVLCRREVQVRARPPPPPPVSRAHLGSDARNA